MLLDGSSWSEIERLEPIQQWCAYYVWDRRQWTDVLKNKAQAAASLGLTDVVNEVLAKVAEYSFPYVEQSRRRYEATATDTLKKLRNLSIRFQQAAPIVPRRKRG